MGVQESFLEEKNMPETADESDETLSLCDLPLYGDQSVEESSSISSSTDYFEFFSHELLPATTYFPPENIIFCGKIIPYKKPDASDTAPSKEIDSKQPTSIKKKPGWSLFRWRLGSKTGKNKTTTLMQKKGHHQTSKKTCNSKKQGRRLDLPLHKMSILTSSPSGKARWYLFLTGISRFSRGMELRDIKNRQSRRHCYSPPPTPRLSVQSHDEEVAGKTSTGSSRLWEVIRVLSCGGNRDPYAMAVGSMSCNQLE